MAFEAPLISAADPQDEGGSRDYTGRTSADRAISP